MTETNAERVKRLVADRYADLPLSNADFFWLIQQGEIVAETELRLRAELSAMTADRDSWQRQSDRFVGDALNAIKERDEARRQIDEAKKQQPVARVWVDNYMNVGIYAINNAILLDQQPLYATPAPAQPDKPITVTALAFKGLEALRYLEAMLRRTVPLGLPMNEGAIHLCEEARDVMEKLGEVPAQPAAQTLSVTVPVTDVYAPSGEMWKEVAQKQSAVPEGSVLVPIEPTPEMIKAAQGIEWTNGSGLLLEWLVAPKIYAAMLAASKEPRHD